MEYDITGWCISIKEAAAIHPPLRQHLNELGKLDLGDAAALAEYNRAIALGLAGLKLQAPQGHLIPAICLRYAYVRILHETYLHQPSSVIEVGTGTTSILSLLAAKEFRYQMIATEIDEASFTWASRNMVANGLEGNIELILSKGGILSGVVTPGNYDACISYPPTYPESDRQQIAEAATHRGFGGSVHEMIGGGPDGFAFIARYLHEACQKPFSIRYVTVLLIFRHHVEPATQLLQEYDRQVEVIEVKAGTRVRFIVVGIANESLVGGGG